MKDYLIVIILLLGVFVYKESQRKVLLLGWSFSLGVMYMALFINLEPSSTLTTFDSNILASETQNLFTSDNFSSWLECRAG